MTVRKKNEINKLIGSAIYRARIKAGMNQPELANAIGVKYQQIQKYEKGEINISVSRLWLISIALKKKMEYFLK